MNIFCVSIHGAFNALVLLESAAPPVRGFYTTRWVLARDEAAAAQKAFRSARNELNNWPDVRDGLVSVTMDAEQIGSGSLWRWLRGGGRGFAFYVDD